MTDGPSDEVTGRAGSEPPGALPPGIRVFAYLLLVYTLQAIGLAVLLYWFDPELVEQLIAAAQGEIPAEDVPEASLGVMIAIQVILLPFVVAVTLLFLRHVDGGRPFAALGVQGPVTPWSPFSTPRVWGRLALIAAATAVGLLVGWLTITGVFADVTVGAWQLQPPASVDQPSDPVGPGDFVLFLLGFLIVAWLEELIFRGYVYTTLRERHNWANAAGITAVVYGLTSVSTPDILPFAMINAFLLGLMLAMSRELTGSLWLGAIGHGCWNFLIACVISLPFAGQDAPSMLEIRAEGATWATGGDFGPEASLVLTVLLLPIAVGLAYLLGRLVDGEAPPDDDPAAADGA